MIVSKLLIRILGLLFFIISLPIILIFSFLIFLSDYRSPVYISQRIGFNGRSFSFYKLRSMIIDADKTGVDSTKSDDSRITPIGKVIRRYKIDEFLQFFCVFNGTMVFVGPRPNVKREVDIYTPEERKLLKVKPGITSISSIVFSDLADILQGCDDANITYNQLVRPWKNRLDLFYIKNRSLIGDILLVATTFISLFSRKKALNMVVNILKRSHAPEELVLISSRKVELCHYPPPGAVDIVTSR